MHEVGICNHATWICKKWGCTLITACTLIRTNTVTNTNGTFIGYVCMLIILIASYFYSGHAGGTYSFMLWRY